jgi:hypothetical protein
LALISIKTGVSGGVFLDGDIFATAQSFDSDEKVTLGTGSSRSD